MARGRPPFQYQVAWGMTFGAKIQIAKALPEGDKIITNKNLINITFTRDWEVALQFFIIRFSHEIKNY
jgi:hypothetical protein